MMRRRAESIRLPLRDLMTEWEQLCSIEKDAHIAISAGEGDGKTNLMLQIILEKLGRRNWKETLWNNIVYTDNPREYYDKYDKLTDDNFIMGFDEALGLMNRLDWAKSDTKKLVHHHRATVRKEKHGVFLYNVQLFRDLHGFWRTHRITYWLELPPREWFAGSNATFVLRRPRIPFITGRRDPWLLDVQEKIWIEQLSRGPIGGTGYINRLRTHQLYIGEFKTVPVPEEVKAHYMDCRIKALEEYVKLEEEMKPSHVKIMDARNNLMLTLKDNGFSTKEIAESCGISERAVNRILKEIREE